jgi:hypothetical protein
MLEPTAPPIEITGLRKKYVNRRGTFRHTKVENVALAGMFTENGSYAALKLIDSNTTTTGVVIATYEPASGDG